MTTAIRPFVESDVAFGLELCRIAGWNQLAADWLRLLQLQPDGLFIAEADGKPCGTASAICHGERVGWIGMILVHPDLRGRGIGSLLMRACIDFLRPRVRTIKLDATDQGRPVYLKLGFVDERPIWRMEKQGLTPIFGAVVVAENGVRPCFSGPRKWGQAPFSQQQQRENGASSRSRVATTDAAAFGANRLSLLGALANEGPGALVADGEATAFGFARPGANAWQLGPVVATEPAAGQEVIKNLLTQIPPGRVFWDLLPENAAALELAQSLDFAPTRKLTRMYLGEEMHAGRVEQVFAGAGFELG